MDIDSVERIQDILASPDLDNIGKSIGIANVIYRVRLYYGEDGKIFMDSNKNGTTFTLILPIIK